MQIDKKRKTKLDILIDRHHFIASKEADKVENGSDIFWRQ